ncbi:hypothetical protein PG984_005690 [Apiospora sp. TS-2023a]
MPPVTRSQTRRAAAEAEQQRSMASSSEDTIGPSYTISNLLGRANPRLVDTGKKIKPSTGDWVTISTENIKKLDGFTNTNLGLMFEDYLNQTVILLPREARKLREAQDEDRRVDTERAFEEYLKPWLYYNAIPCVNKTVANFQERLGLPKITYSIVTQYQFGNYKGTTGKSTEITKHFVADWAVVFPDDWRPVGVELVGENKRRKNLDPNTFGKIKPGSSEKDNTISTDVRAAIWCLRQCGTYAWRTRCRYTFLVTPEYVTIFRFNMIKEGPKDRYPDQTILGVEYDFFPYANEGEHQLTLTKAIWAQVMMAQNPQQRGIIPLDEMLPFNSWYSYTAGEQTYFIHHISELIKDDLPGNQPNIESISNAEDEVLRRVLARLALHSQN